MKSCIDVAAEHGIILITDPNGWHGGVCPRHADTAPSLRISDDGATFVCMGCQKTSEHASGDVISFVRFLTGASFIEARDAVGGEQRAPDVVLEDALIAAGTPKAYPSVELRLAAAMRLGLISPRQADGIMAADDASTHAEKLLDTVAPLV